MMYLPIVAEWTKITSILYNNNTYVFHNKKENLKFFIFDQRSLHSVKILQYLHYLYIIYLGIMLADEILVAGWKCKHIFY